MLTLRHRGLWKELELGLGGGAKFRILLCMLLNPKEKFTKYSIVKATGLRTPNINEQLNSLIEI